MQAYQFSAVRSLADGRHDLPRECQHDFAASAVGLAWERVAELLPCNGEWDCALRLVSRGAARRLKPRVILVTRFRDQGE